MGWFNYFTKFAVAYRCGVRYGRSGGCKRHNEAFIALVLGNSKSGSFNHSQGCSNDRRLSGMITIGTGVCASILHAFISYGVRLRVARSTVMGTCQSLELRDEHQVWLSRFFHIYQYIAKEEGPAATMKNNV